MSKINKYACKEEIEEFLDELKLENHVRQHGEIKAFVLEYMLKNPPGKGCVVQVGTFGKTTRSDTHGQNAHGLIISYVCPRLIPLAGDQLMQKRIGGHHVCCRYDGSTKQYVILIQVNQSNEITDAPINAAKENMTDMFYHTDEYVTENEIDNFLDGLQIERLVKEHQYVSHAIRSILLDYMPVPNRSMQVTTIGKPPATSDNHETKEFGFYIRYQVQKTPAGDNNHPTSIRVGGHHIRGSYNPSIKEFVISVRFNNYNKFQDNSENVRTSILKSREEAAQAQKEIKMNEQKEQSVMTRYAIHAELVEKGTSEAVAGAIALLLVQFGFDLRIPNPEVFQDKCGILFTYGNNSRFIEAAKKSMRIGGQNIEWVMDHEGGVFHITENKKKPLSREELIGKHVPAIELEMVLEDGTPISLPGNVEVIAVNEQNAFVSVKCDVQVSFRQKTVGHLREPAILDILNSNNKRFMVNNQEYTEQELAQKREEWTAQGIINPEQGSWKDIGA